MSPSIVRTFDVNGSHFVATNRLGTGREGTVYLARKSDTPPDADNTVVAKQFESSDDLRRNYLALKRLERLLASPKVAPHTVVAVLDKDDEQKILLLEYAHGLQGDKLYNDESYEQTEHPEAEKFANAFRTLYAFVDETPQLRWRLATKNVVWQPESQRIVIFDPF